MKRTIFKTFFSIVISLMFLSCNYSQKAKKQVSNTYPKVKIAGAIKNKMLKGELDGTIELDTISDKKGLYGLGPITYLTGEILINNGITYISKVLTDSTMLVEKESKVAAPFFVYGNVNIWKTLALSDSISNISDLEKFIDKQTIKHQKPFVFKLIGKVNTAKIHIQNSPSVTKVSSPKEAHQGQVNYNLTDEDVEIIGFFSKVHQGVFTHKGSYLHMHLITKDESQMGHLDMAEFGEMTLFLPAT